MVGIQSHSTRFHHLDYPINFDIQINKHSINFQPEKTATTLILQKLLLSTDIPNGVGRCQPPYASVSV